VTFFFVMEYSVLEIVIMKHDKGYLRQVPIKIQSFEH
jgi:hypothetical protein